MFHFFLPCWLKAAVASATLGLASVFGQTTQFVVWGSEIEFGNVLTSDGGAVTLNEFKFELGTFGSFVPTASNTSDWLTHWKIFDAITLDDPISTDAFIAGSGTTAIFGGRADLLSDRTSNSEDADPTDTFIAGEQAYIFVRDGDIPAGDTEWLLYTSESHPQWGFPGGFSEELQWYVPDAETVVWGAVNGTTVGAGEFTDTSSDFFIRTHTFEFISVPEPSAFLLLLVGSLGLVSRRRQ